MKVTYVDGEMSQQDLQKRIRGLGLANKNLHIINHDAFFRENGTIFCLSDEVAQNALLQDCYNHDTKVLVLDNLSSLFRGVEESSADDWETILSWLLKCRRYGISVLIVHHSGKSGDQRGTSRREDAAAWCIKLDAIGREDIAEGELKFQAIFTKSRHAGFPRTTEWTFKIPADDAPITFTAENKGMLETMLDLIRRGVDNNADLAEHFSISRAKVTKLFHQLETSGLAYKDGQKYRAGKAEKEPGPVEVNARPIEDAVIAVVQAANNSITAAEISEALKAVAKWKGTVIKSTIHKLVKTGKLEPEDIPNPKAGTGKGQRKTVAAYRTPSV